MTTAATKPTPAITSAIEAGYIYFDGEIVPQEEAKVSVLTHALHYGTSVFEGIRAYETSQGAAIFRLNEHSKRLLESAKIIGMKPAQTLEQINQAEQPQILLHSSASLVRCRSTRREPRAQQGSHDGCHLELGHVFRG